MGKLAEEKRKQEEMKKKQKREAEELKRKQEEAKKKEAEEEVKRKLSERGAKRRKQSCRRNDTRLRLRLGSKLRRKPKRDARLRKSSVNLQRKRENKKSKK